MIRIGLDVGSTTLKCVALDDNGQIIYNEYQRHYSKISEKTAEMLKTLSLNFPDSDFSVTISGSAGMGIANALDIQFVQEVYATRIAVKSRAPQTDVVIELGGEDAKILFLDGSLEVRMNGSCAGGTGAFIDQMATLLDISPDELNALAANHEKIHTIASRCGVFAKSDIQPLINQGASKSDICASILYAVVNQTIAGLAQGREISGNIVYLGGPLTFLSQLRRSFDKTLATTGFCPEYSLYFVALGAALVPHKKTYPSLDNLIEQVERYHGNGSYAACKPLFKSKEDYEEFKSRHDKAYIRICDKTPEAEYPVWFGIDAGSTTVKAVAINENEEIVFERYLPNSGNPVSIVKNILTEFYSAHISAQVVSSCVTGYGEDIIKNAFNVDHGIVETIAHYTAAAKFDPDVDFIIDIGGQDIKCFKVRNGTIDNIFLNEACSSGCGSFLQTFAGALGYSINEFAEKGIYADNPVDLGSRCTVFMNSSVKQAQKDGATIDNISAGLSISVVKNAIYKVIRASSAKELGEHIIVQGGTFYNDAVLRAFEQELGYNVIRPSISGLMGAYGSALYARRSGKAGGIISRADLEKFTHNTKIINCGGCSNNCRLTVNTFSNGEKYISGNRCEKPNLKKNSSGSESVPNLFRFKLEAIESYKTSQKGTRGRIGIPLGLNMFEMLPFWSTFWQKLGFEVVVSDRSSRKLYLSGQHTIPSDTVCFPAKLMHGHIESLLKKNVDAIFYPCLTYNFDENISDNHFNCPVVAYYPEVLVANVGALADKKVIYDYIDPSRKDSFVSKMTKIIAKYFRGVAPSEVLNATESAFSEYKRYMDSIKAEGKKYLAYAKEHDLPVIVLCGRPYHLDPEINHGIDQMISDMGAVIVTEDAISYMVDKFPLKVLNQWTYHARLYAAAKYVSKNQANYNINIVQLVSFGCGVDAITTDEMRRILESDQKIYTQIKIDEITNLGAVKIRLRSLFAALEQQNKKVNDQNG